MFKKFAAMFTYMVAFLGVSGNEQALIKDGELHLTDKQKEDLQKALGPRVKLEEVVTAMNAELADINKIDTDAQDEQLIDLRKKAFDMLKEHEFTDAEAKKLIDNPSAAEGKTEKQLLAGLVTAMEEQKTLAKEQDKKIAKLLSSAEDDSPLQVIKSTVESTMKHSKTHLFGIQKDYNAFEDRPWNQLAAGQSVAMPSFAKDSLEVEKLQGDLDLYYKEVKSDVNSLFRDFLKLPSFWPIRTNVTDRVADGNIVTAEITQPRKKGWLPKNKQMIQPEEAKIYPVQVDIEHAGYVLQTLLTSWLNTYNKEGSQAYKWSFVKFLLVELDKRARQEDRIVAIKGVHVPTPDNATIPGLAINRSDGILIKLWRAYFIDKKYKSANIGAPTPNNIVDYVKALIEKNVPEEEKNNAGLIIYLSKTWLRTHVERKRVLFGLDNNYTGQELLEIENYPNVKLCPLDDLEGSDFMFITYDDNIEVLENIPAEKSMYHMESLKRDMYIFADYKFGVRIRHIGTKVKDGDPAAFKVQTVWTNRMPIFKDDFYVRLYDNTTGEVELPYGNITITDDWATSIDTLKGAYEGQIVRIKGNTAVGAGVKVTDDGNITLAGNADFALNSGGTLTLRATTATTFTEIKRTVAPPVAPDADVNFTGTEIDALLGNEFNYAGTGAKTITAIENGIEGQEIVVNGGAGGALTFADVPAHINVGAAAVLADGADNITLTMIDGVWEEVARTIAE